jgi:hypothetical protein
MSYAFSPEVRHAYWLNHKRTILDEARDLSKYFKMVKSGDFPVGLKGKPGFASLGEVPEQKGAYDAILKMQQEAKSALVAEILNRNPAT